MNYTCFTRLIDLAVEYDPLIPAETKLLLTTNPSTIANSLETRELGMNIHANDRYFDRPEVVKAYREQLLIQTPEFSNISENPAAMGRLRPRNSEDVCGHNMPCIFLLTFFFFINRGQLTPQMQHMKKGIASTKHSRSVYDYEKRKSLSTNSIN